MEFVVRMNSGKSSQVPPLLKLHDKKTGHVTSFPLFQYNQLKSFKGNNLFQGVDMSKMEIEYDYDTDEEQRSHSQNMMLSELSEAIDFFVKEDPIKLVSNVML